jgi:hypothetical protein
MKLLLSFLLSVASIVPALASEIRLVSPDHARTYVFGEVVAHQLFVDGNVLAARITFSNVSYSTKSEPRRDEAFDFRFLGTRLDPAARTFYLSSRRKSKVAVAVTRPGWLDEAVALSPGTKIYVLKESGRVTVVLSATPEPRAGLRWVEVNRAPSLHSYLCMFFAHSD